jgi:hypothetical protein
MNKLLNIVLLVVLVLMGVQAVCAIKSTTIVNARNQAELRYYETATQEVEQNMQYRSQLQRRYIP